MNHAKKVVIIAGISTLLFAATAWAQQSNRLQNAQDSLANELTNIQSERKVQRNFKGYLRALRNSSKKEGNGKVKLSRTEQLIALETLKLDTTPIENRYCEIADASGDGVYNIFDQLEFLNLFARCQNDAAENCAADLNDDGSLTPQDFLLFRVAFAYATHSALGCQ